MHIKKMKSGFYRIGATLKIGNLKVKIHQTNSRDAPREDGVWRVNRRQMIKILETFPEFYSETIWHHTPDGTEYGDGKIRKCTKDCIDWLIKQLKTHPYRVDYYQHENIFKMWCSALGSHALILRDTQVEVF